MTMPSNTSPYATTSTGQANMGTVTGRKSISSQHGRRREKFFSLFRSAKSEETSATVTPLQKVSNPQTGVPHMIESRKARLNIFSKNVHTRAASLEVPKIGTRINSTPQLALCYSLLLRNQGVQDQVVQDQAEDALQDGTTNRTSLNWVKAIQNDTVEQYHIRWLGVRMVEEFCKDRVKDSAAITEVVLLGPVLGREHYRKLLNCFISEFRQAVILDVHMLQGLIQLVQCAAEGYLIADDLVKIFSILRERLQNTHQQSTEHPYHLTLAVSRLLDVMAEHKVQDVKRVEEHEPLSEILSGLRNSSDPYLMYQASCAYQALQYVPDDETPLQAVMRHSAGVAASLVKISGVIKLDLGSVLEGLKGFQEALSKTYDIAKSGYEGICSLKESGRGLFDSLKGLGTGQKRLWYPALRAADGFVRQGKLADLNQLIIEAPCRRDPLFQWGICQLLGEIAADENWDLSTRQQAVDLLVDLYKNDMDWAKDESVKGWMLAIIVQLEDASHLAIKDYASHQLDDLKKDGDSSTSHPYPLKARLPMPLSSPLLARVHDIPYVEYDLHQLKRQRLKEQEPAVYIAPMAKPTQQAPDSDAFPLMEKVTEFLVSERQVMLILGDSGAGKSTFNRHLECALWRDYKSGGWIPLFINMPALSKPNSELIAEQLRMHNFSEAQILELKLYRQLIVICDGYDESQLTTNIYTANKLNQPGQWNVKLVVSCRSQYLGREYRDLFVPQGSDHYSAPALQLFQEAIITPFSRSQIEDYVEQYVPLEPRPWATEDYMKRLTTIPNLMDLVTNPFLLILSLGALPTVVRGKQDLTTVRVTRVALYDSFVEHWIGVNKRRLQKQKLEPSSRTVLAELIEDDFERNGVEYQKQLAAAIFKEQDGKPVVDYSHKRDKLSWKAKFLGPEPEPSLLRGCSLLNRVGNQYRFIHRSILEYFYSRFVYETSRINNEFSQTTGSSVAAFVHPIADHPLSQRDLVSEPSIIQYLCERVQEDAVYKEHLLAIVETSKTDPDANQAASNAITILVRAGVMFNGADLQSIRIPGADLSGGQFDSAQLQKADLRNTNLRNIWIRQADLSNAQMEGVQFGEWPFLEEDGRVESCAYSPDGKLFAVGLLNGIIHLYKTATWEKTLTLRGNNPCGKSVAFSPSGMQIASGNNDKTVSVWDTQTGAPGATFNSHIDYVTSMVFSPNGQQIASGSVDRTVRLWNAQTGAPGTILRGHADTVTCVAFSPSGQQIASGSSDKTIRLWDARTGASGVVLNGHTDSVTCVVFSPSGQQIASGSPDKTVRLWNAQTGASDAVLSGHTNFITSVVFSPNGQQIASGSRDDTLRLWNAQTFEPGTILRGHSWGVMSVVFSPSGQQIASGSGDQTVRLWDAQIGEGAGTYTSSHSSSVMSVMFSPSGQQIVSGSLDKTVRLWGTQTGAPSAILSGHTRDVTGVVFSPSGQQIASGSMDKTVRLWDAHTGAPGAILSGHKTPITSVAFSPCGRQIASSSYDKTVRLWNAQTGAPGAILSDHSSFVTSVVFSPSGQQVVSGSYDRTARLWDAQTGESGAILEGHLKAVMSVAFSPDGQQIASGSDDETVRLWDARTGATGTVLSGHTDSVRSVAYSPSGKQIVSGSDDKTMRLWDVDTARCLAVVHGFHGIVHSVAWRAYGNDSYIATGCEDKSVRLWQVIGDQHLVRLRWSSTHDQLALSNASIDSAQGLSKANTKLLVQRGAVGQSMTYKEQ